MERSVRTLFFLETDRGQLASRLHVSPDEAGVVVSSVIEIRRRIRWSVEVIAAMTSCAKSKTPPPFPLEYEAARAIEDLAHFARTLEDLEHVLTGRRPPGVESH